MSHLLDPDILPWVVLILLVLGIVCVVILFGVSVARLIAGPVESESAPAAKSSNAMCLAVGHRWDDPEWTLKSLPPSMTDPIFDHRPEYWRDQHCTRKGCGGYRIQVKREGGRVRNVSIA